MQGLFPPLESADVFLPSAGEGKLFTGAASDEEGCRKLAAQGKIIVLKQGAKGCRIFTRDQELQIPAFAVEEVDPTGAGDSFSAGFTVAMLEGMPLAEAGRFANAVGTLEGAPPRDQVRELMRR